MRRRMIGVAAAAGVLLAALGIAVILPFLSARFEQIRLPDCLPGAGVPFWRIEAWRTWCSSSRTHSPADAYRIVALDVFGDEGMTCTALGLFRRAEKHGNAESLVYIGRAAAEGKCGPRDPAGAIAAWEQAAKHPNRHPAALLLAAGDLRQFYEARHRYPAWRDLGKSAMWGFAASLALGVPERGAIEHGRRLGLDDAEIAAARDRMRRWLIENGVPLARH